MREVLAVRESCSAEGAVLSSSLTHTQRQFQMRSWEACRRFLCMCGLPCSAGCGGPLALSSGDCCDSDRLCLGACAPLSHCQPCSGLCWLQRCAEGGQLGGFGAGLELVWGRQGAQSVSKREREGSVDGNVPGGITEGVQRHP